MKFESVPQYLTLLTMKLKKENLYMFSFYVTENAVPFYYKDQRVISVWESNSGLLWTIF